MKMKKLLSTLLSLALITSLVACSTDTSSGVVDEGGAETGDTTEADGTVEHFELHVMGTDRWEFEGGYDNNMQAYADSQQVHGMFLDMLAEENISLTFEIVQGEQYDTAVQTRMASGNNMPDFLRINGDVSAVVKMGTTGIIKPIDQILEEQSPDGVAYNYLFKDNQWVSGGNIAEDGHLYFITGTYEINTQLPGQEPIPCEEQIALTIRRDWVEALGEEMPTTLDEYTDLLYAFRENDMNQNGEADEVLSLNGISIEPFQNGVAQSFGLVYGVTGQDAITKEVTSPWLQPGIADYLAYVKQLVDDGVIPAETIGAQSYNDQMMINNRVASIFTFPTQSWLESSILDTDGNVVEEAYFSPLLPLAAVDGIEPILVDSPAKSAGAPAWVFTSSCEDDAGIARFLDVFYSEETLELANYGIEGVTFTEEDGVKKHIWDGLDPDEMFEKVAQLQNDGLMYMNDNFAGGGGWGANIFPAVGLFNNTQIYPGTDMEEKMMYLRNAPKYEYQSRLYESAYLAIPTEEEAELIAKHATDLESISAELFAQFVLGQKPLEELDEAIETMKQSGLLEVIEVKQARADRYEGYTGYDGPIPD